MAVLDKDIFLVNTPTVFLGGGHLPFAVFIVKMSCLFFDMPYTIGSVLPLFPPLYTYIAYIVYSIQCFQNCLLLAWQDPLTPHPHHSLPLTLFLSQPLRHPQTSLSFPNIPLTFPIYPFPSNHSPLPNSLSIEYIQVF